MNEEINKKTTHNVSPSSNKSKRDTESKSTNIHSAAANGDIEKIEEFINKGIPVNSLSRDNWTPLHNAVVSNQTKVVALLINKGADVYAKDTNGKTPLDIAKEKNLKELIEIFNQSQVSTGTQYSDSSTAKQSSFPTWAVILVGGTIGAASGLFMGYSLYQNSEYGEVHYLYIWGVVNVIIFNILWNLSRKTVLVYIIMLLIFGFIGYNHYLQ